MTTEKNESHNSSPSFQSLFVSVFDVKLSPIVVWTEGSELMASMSMCFQAEFGTKITTAIDCFELYYILQDDPV